MKNNALLYCQQKIAPMGSDWYYSLLGAQDAARNIFLALLTLDREWHDVLLLVHEPSVALAKFAWWREELLKTFTRRQATHPATQLLLTELDHYPVNLNALTTILDNYQNRLQPVFYQTEQEWLAQIVWQENIYLLLAKLVSEVQEDCLKALSQGLLLADWIIHLRQYLKHGEITFSREALMQYGIDQNELWQLKSSEGLQALLQHYSELAIKNLSVLRKCLTVKERKQQKILLRYAKLQMKLLKEIVQAQFPLLTQNISLTPIRKLLICWF